MTVLINSLCSFFPPQTSTWTHYSVSWSAKKTWCPTLGDISWRNSWPLFTTISSTPIINVCLLSADSYLHIISPCLNLFFISHHPCVWSFLRPANEGRSAVPCAYSYFLFEPKDRVMKQNLLYYEAYSEQWGLQPEHFTARTVRRRLSHCR